MRDDTALERQIEAVRGFNRFYTRRIGVVRDGYLDGGFSLTEARVLYELARTERRTATEIAAALALDAGYLSRMLRRFERDGLLARHPDADDRRRAELTLTRAGRAAFAALDAAARQQIGAMLAPLPAPARETLVTSMRTVAEVLGESGAPVWTARDPRPGDIGWVIERHAALYAEEYGFDHRFESFVARVGADFLDDRDPAMERAWIAERGGVRVGSIVLVRHSKTVGKLRLLIVEPTARGLGIGKGLVEICLNFARAAGYRRVTLWTNDILVAAREIYRAAGFRLVTRTPHQDFGPPMVGEEWVKDLPRA